MPHPQELLANRSVIEPGKFAVISPEGRVINTIPGLAHCAMTILASPKLGAGFVQMVGTVSEAGHTTLPYGGQPGIEVLLHVLDGPGSLTVTVGTKATVLTAGGYVYAPPGAGVHFRSLGDGAVRILLYKQRFVPHPAPDMHPPWTVIGSTADMKETPYAGLDTVFVRDLLPVDEAFDMNFHTLAFAPGGCHPFVETHVQEHGAYITGGQGLYLLDRTWIPIQAEDFLWFAPFCMQACYGIGAERLEYIYSKDCNRDEPV
jgi:(S)-ureidoglycine aminohydrolase